jgi:hypothetical protein
MKIEDDINYELGRLPQTLADLYAVIYEQITQTGIKGRLIAERALKWLLCAQESLHTETFIAAVSVGSGEYTRLTKEDVLELCCNFIIFDGKLDTFRFAHISVREYLEGRSEYSVNEINALALERCLDVYLYNQETVLVPDPIAERHRQLRPYAKSYWTAHYQKLDREWRKECFKNKVEHFLFQGQDVNPSFTRWIEKFPSRNDYRLQPTPLFIACKFGLLEIIEKLNAIENTIWNLRNNDGDSALHLAVENGHEAVVKLLLDSGKIDTNSKGHYGRTPLSLAARGGHENMVKLLLDSGKVDVDPKDDCHGQTPLSCVAERA